MRTFGAPKLNEKIDDSTRRKRVIDLSPQLSYIDKTVIRVALKVKSGKLRKYYSIYPNILVMSKVESTSPSILPIRISYTLYIYVHILPFFQSVSDIHARAQRTLARVKRVRARRRAVHHVCM